MTRVGFVGAGRMGGPMVSRLVEAGHEVRALGRTDEKRRAVAELGAQPVAGLHDIARDADVLIVCVFTDEQVAQVCSPGVLAAMSPGSTLVVHTTGSPRTVQTVAAHSPNIDVLDAPVSGGPHNIAAGALTLFVGGPDDAVARVRPVLAAYGDPILHVGPLGAGQAVKLTNNALFAAQIGLLREAVALGDRFGVGEAELLEAITHGSGASTVAGFVAAGGSVDTFVERTSEFIGKDVEVVRKIAAELGEALGLLDDVIDAGIQS
ncbi:6-phosphogluconate dehydrogenase [Mycolicibacterium moriokaense]|uniref:6-phosphogluconate dehydrogenase n=1 Tax=Mycolicibacterium moriokaense TaxID=39691 RepID=A0AAD1HB96_9MYCO|nr:NAD(P)-dependent oxidoreductase [Mycolicibacterium moriokaense]MCV7041765.1 NAD(P)-dependent oxidoreductase [Mycolicibacterium moriokaense]ORB21825.1 6-phosphogluconate dehydrogenase [Mycolicibacterium moriokaense]BBX01449.1 6-phosphogluconate dehydrogenase [Mycolicibacterium moriokaense]